MNVKVPDERESTVSTSDLAPCPGTENERQKVPNDVNPPTEPTDSSVHKRCDSLTGRFDAETLTDTEPLTEDNSKTSLSLTKVTLQTLRKLPQMILWKWMFYHDDLEELKNLLTVMESLYANIKLFYEQYMLP